MNSKVLVIGANGGIGNCCVDKFSSQGYAVDSLTSAELDLNYPDRIFDLDFTAYDIIVNCAGHSQGTYRGFLNNDWNNQVSQITVNYISNLALLKHFARSRSQGKYIWINSILTQKARPFHSVYASSKIASKFAIDLIRQEATHIDILEVIVGVVKTNFKSRNFEGTQSQEVLDREYIDQSALDPADVAKQIVNATLTDLKEINIYV